MAPSATLEIEESAETDVAALPDRWIPVRRYDPSFEQFLDGQLAELSSLAPGWDGRNAAIVNPQVLTAARQLLESIQEVLTTRPIIVPMAHGAVQLEWHRGPKVLELEIEDPRTIHYLRWNPEAQVEDEDFLDTSDLASVRTLLAWFEQN